MLCALAPVLSPPSAHADDLDAGCPRSVTAYVCVTFASPGVHNSVVLRPSTAFDGSSNCVLCDVHARNGDYRTRITASGPDQAVDALNGVSVGKLITYASDGMVNADDVTFTQTSRISSTSPYQALLDNSSGANELSPTRFEGGFAPVVYFTTASVPNAGYIRPLLAGDDNDVNGADSFETGTDFIHVVVHTQGQVLHPTVSATPGKLRTGGTATLTADLGNVPSDGDYSYAWSFGDGEDPLPAATDQRTVTHPYTKAGAYVPVVTVTDSKYTSYGQSSDSGPLVTVGDAPSTPPRNRSTGAGTGSSGNPPDGPVDGTGTKRRGAATPVPGDGAGGSAGPGNGTPAPAGGSAASGSGSAATGRPRPPAAGGEFVHGFALSAPDRAGARSSAAAGQTAAPAARRPGRDRLDLRWLLWLVPIGLAALGVFTERRRPRRRGSHL